MKRKARLLWQQAPARLSIRHSARFYLRAMKSFFRGRYTPASAQDIRRCECRMFDSHLSLFWRPVWHGGGWRNQAGRLLKRLRFVRKRNLFNNRPAWFLHPPPCQTGRQKSDRWESNIVFVLGYKVWELADPWDFDFFYIWIKQMFHLASP